MHRRHYPKEFAHPTRRSPANFASYKVVRRLWPNYREVEADYYRRTGIFPIRHVVVVKDEVLRRNPEVAARLGRVFEDAKQHAYRYWAHHRRSYLAAFGAEQEEERALLGPDPWHYSIEQNRVALETLLDYAVEQRLTERRLAIKEIFAPGTLDRQHGGRGWGKKQFNHKERKEHKIENQMQSGMARAWDRSIGT